MRNGLICLTLGLLAVVLTVTVQDFEIWRHWIAFHTGSLNTPGTPPNYNYWSGFGSVFPWELGLFVSVWVWFLTHYRVINCHVDRCPRIGRYPVAGGHFKVCRRHHPESHVRLGNVSFEHIQAVHALHLLRSGVGRLPKEKQDP